MEQQLPSDEFDERAFAELREDLGDSFTGFVAQFIASAHSALDEIDDSLRRGDDESAGAQAHSLRGTAGYLGAVRMCKALDALQHGTQDGAGREDIRRHAAEARDAFMTVKARWLLPT